MSLKTPKFIYFDLGNVLVTFCNERMCRQMAAVANAPIERVYEVLYGDAAGANDLTDTVQWRFEAGRFSGHEYYEHVCELLGARPERSALAFACADMFEPIDASMRLVERLAAAGCRLGLLSNTNAWHWEHLLDGRFAALNNAFELEVTSFGAQAMKPDPTIYLHAAQAAGCDPEEIFFTDDRPENVEGARKAGFDAERFESTELLIDHLRQRGVSGA
ncbi:Alpha-D-glucose-1-phosphate phosphatase YihX [Pseudobythopirellula maris]|uniref:Alpha-D-glucose-1-phosphate phosphatase YihX n=1 Tax=Pseudobythopirellula maris TaxID=2527991 RepID=A0A5C5ZUR0_9BACT|nr:HAD family phosphatase [Pseudobythopirellula maris]TWT89953.1 Alpha-D-glucose-1-phosphate phosphatase YihX [Pseudobythopirellula maris]